MSAVSAAVAAPLRTFQRSARRSLHAAWPAAAGAPRRPGVGGRAPVPGPAALDLAPVLLATAGLAAFAALCLPALRIELAIGWLPLWLVAAPLASWAALRLARRRARSAAGDVPRVAPRRAAARVSRRVGAQAVRRAPGGAGLERLRQAA